MARPSRNSCTAYALRNYSQKDVLNVQITEVSVHAVLDHCSSVMRWMVVTKVCVECGYTPYIRGMSSN